MLARPDGAGVGVEQGDPLGLRMGKHWDTLVCLCATGQLEQRPLLGVSDIVRVKVRTKISNHNTFDHTVTPVPTIGND